MDRNIWSLGNNRVFWHSTQYDEVLENLFK